MKREKNQMNPVDICKLRWGLLGEEMEKGKAPVHYDRGDVNVILAALDDILNTVPSAEVSQQAKLVGLYSLMKAFRDKWEWGD